MSLQFGVTRVALSIFSLKPSCTHQGAGVFKPSWESTLVPKPCSETRAVHRLLGSIQLKWLFLSCCTTSLKDITRKTSPQHPLNRTILPTPTYYPTSTPESQCNVNFSKSCSAQTRFETTEAGTSTEGLAVLPAVQSARRCPDSLSPKSSSFSWNTRETGLVQQMFEKGHLNTTTGDTMCCWCQLHSDFSFICKIKEFLRAAWKSHRSPSQKAWGTRAAFANLSNNFILICFAPWKNEVILLMKWNRIPPPVAAAIADTQIILVSFFILLDFRILVFLCKKSGPLFLLGDLM